MAVEKIALEEQKALAEVRNAAVEVAIAAARQMLAQDLGAERRARSSTRRSPPCRKRCTEHFSVHRSRRALRALLRVRNDAPHPEEAAWRPSRGSPVANCLFRRCEGEAEIAGDGGVGDVAVMDVEPGAQMRVVQERAAPALLGERQHEGQGRVVEREGRGARHRARHVGDAVVDDALLDIGGIGMRRRPAGLEAAALVDRDVDEHRARLHPAHHLAA